MSNRINSQYMTFRFDDQDLETRFRNLVDNKYSKIFQNLNILGVNYTVGYNEAKALVNGAYSDTFDDTADIIQMGFEAPPKWKGEIIRQLGRTIGKIHRSSNSIQGLKNKLGNLLQEFNKYINERNAWNIVWYASYDRASSV